MRIALARLPKATALSGGVSGNENDNEKAEGKGNNMKKPAIIYLHNHDLHQKIKIQAAKEGIKLYYLVEKALNNYMVDIKKPENHDHPIHL